MKYLFIGILLIFSTTVEAQDSTNRQESPINELPAPNNSKRKGLKDKIQNLGIGKGVRKTKDNMAISVALQQARLAEFQKRYLAAIAHYKKVVDLHAGLNQQQEVTDYSQQIALLYLKAGRTKEALDQYQYVLERKEITGDTTNLAIIREQLTNLQPEPVDMPLPLEAPLEDILTQKETEKETTRLKTMAETTENSQNYKESLEYYKLYTELNNQQKEAEQAQQLALQDKTFQLEKQAQQMSLLESEREIQLLNLSQREEQLAQERTFKQNLLVGITLLTIAVLATFFLYRGKRRALGELNQAYDDLSHTKDRLVDAEGQLQNLLDQQVSKGVARQLMNSGKADVGEKKFVCVMFLDIRGFTPFAEKLEPEELIKYQNDVFGLMIDIIDQNQGVINQFLGDGFMATFGLPDEASNVCENALKAAVKIITLVNEKSDSGEIPKTRLGIGLHAGNVVAGNVGTSIRKQYSVTGNTVITAARIEQLNKRFKSQLLISREVFSELKQTKDLPGEFIKVEVKGRERPVELLKIA